MTHSFYRYELRTTDVASARAFYRSVLGSSVWDLDASVSLLPPRAAARGAPAHWLGHVAVDDLDDAVARYVALGEQPLLARAEGAEGAPYGLLRDRSGGVFAVSVATASQARSVVAWHQLHTRDHIASLALYTALFGWGASGPVDDAAAGQPFAWTPVGPTVGGMSNTVAVPHPHPQWLFFFQVDRLEQALERVRAHGGLTLPVTKASSGQLYAPCDDPQGAAFGLVGT